jgi:hypothetical protein
VQTETKVRIDLSARGNIDCCFLGRSIDRYLRTRVLWKTSQVICVGGPISLPERGQIRLADLDARHEFASGEDVGFRGKQSRYVAWILIARGRDLLLSAPSIIMRSKVNTVGIDIVAPDPTAQAVESRE